MNAGGSRRPTDGGRIAGIDIARGVAIIGMFVAHTIPRVNDDAELVVDGRSSILFATLAGVSLGIVTGGSHPLPRGSRANRVVSILLRATCLFLLGGLLGSLGSGIAIILDFYAFMFVLLTPALFLGRPAIAALAGMLVFAAPALATTLASPDSDEAPVASFVHYYLLGGAYPALIWMPFLLAGLLCARSGLTQTRTQLAMVGCGVLAAVAGYGSAAILPGVSAEEHSGSSAEVVGSGGVAVAVIGGLLWLTASERAGLGRVIRRSFWPVGAAGSMALTVYTLQILALAAIVVLQENGGGDIEYPGWPLLVGLTLCSLSFASAWRATLGTGPLERLLGFVTRPPRTDRAGVPSGV